MAIPERFLGPVHTVSADTSARAAARAMKAHGVGALVLTDAGGEPVGLVTDRDVALTVLRRGLDPVETLVSECTKPGLVTLGRGRSLLDAVRLMRESLVRRLPIVGDDGELVGLLSADDLLGSFGEELRWISETAPQGRRNETSPPEHSASVLGKE